jgi:hypothetical protein
VSDYIAGLRWNTGAGAGVLDGNRARHRLARFVLRLTARKPRV